MKSSSNERKDVVFQVAVLIGGAPDNFRDALDLVSSKAGIGRQYMSQVCSGHQHFGPNTIEKIRRLLAENGSDLPTFVNLDVLGKGKGADRAKPARRSAPARKQTSRKAAESAVTEPVDLSTNALPARKVPSCIGGIAVLPTSDGQLKIHLPRGFTLVRLETDDRGDTVSVQLDLRFD